MEETTKKDTGGKLIALYFVLFFVVIVIVNSIFIYMSLITHTGVITKNHYEAGLAYDELLEKAKSQPKLHDKTSYNQGVLRWELIDENNKPITNAVAEAKIIRLVQDGYDFETQLENIGNGVYEAIISLPLKGVWEARLSGKWNNKQYQTTYQIIEN